MKAKNEQQKKEDCVWMARCELETLRNDTEIGFLRLTDIYYQDNLLKIRFKASFVPDELIKDFIDERILKDFMAMIVLHPEKWSNVAKYLMKAQVDLQIIYSTIDRHPLVVSAKCLRDMLENKQTMQEAKEKFVEYKLKEILTYARSHFKHDYYLHVDTLLLEKKFVSLQLSYNDQKYNLGSIYINPKHVPQYFTDKVGDMGSILNGMLSICVRTEKGFSFIFKGSKLHRIHRCSWSVGKAKEMYHELNENLWLDYRDPNQVKSVINYSKSSVSTKDH